MPPPVDPDTRAAVEAALLDEQDHRSRAALAREHGVSPRTVTRWANELGVDTDARWSTADTRKATESATDRRRALRSDIADQLLQVEVPRLLDRMAGPWRRTVLIGRGMGEQDVEQVDEDDAAIAKGYKELHTALGIAVDKSIAIDRHDEQVGDSGAAEVLAELGATLAHYARERRGDEHEQEGPA